MIRRDNTAKERKFAAKAAACITLAFGVAAAFAAGLLDGQRMFGICGFEQRRGIPCPTCGMTRSVILFVRGDIIGSLRMQPAAAVICVILVLLWVYFVLRTLGFAMPRTTKLLRSLKPITIVIAAVILLLIGWAATLYGRV